jgi:hypothetical protein
MNSDFVLVHRGFFFWLRFVLGWLLVLCF